MFGGDEPDLDGIGKIPDDIRLLIRFALLWVPTEFSARESWVLEPESLQKLGMI